MAVDSFQDLHSTITPKMSNSVIAWLCNLNKTKNKWKEEPLNQRSWRSNWEVVTYPFICCKIAETFCTSSLMKHVQIWPVALIILGDEERGSNFVASCISCSKWRVTMMSRRVLKLHWYIMVRDTLTISSETTPENWLESSVPPAPSIPRDNQFNHPRDWFDVGSSLCSFSETLCSFSVPVAPTSPMFTANSEQAFCIIGFKAQRKMRKCQC